MEGCILSYHCQALKYAGFMPKGLKYLLRTLAFTLQMSLGYHQDIIPCISHVPASCKSSNIWGLISFWLEQFMNSYLKEGCAVFQTCWTWMWGLSCSILCWLLPLLVPTYFVCSNSTYRRFMYVYMYYDTSKFKVSSFRKNIPVYFI